MKQLSTILAQVDVSELLGVDKQTMEPRVHYWLIMFGAISVAIVLAFIWAVLFGRAKKKRKHHKHRHHRPESGPAAAPPLKTAATTPSDKEKSRRHSRGRRRRQRTLNPTLAQTRGLPPLRDENAPLPPMP